MHSFMKSHCTWTWIPVCTELEPLRAVVVGCVPLPASDSQTGCWSPFWAGRVLLSIKGVSSNPVTAAQTWVCANTRMQVVCVRFKIVQRRTAVQTARSVFRKCKFCHTL